MKIKVNDTVQVIAGKEKGKKGKVMRVYKKLHKVTVEKINVRIKHIKKTPQRAGERIKFEAPMDISNVMVLCPECNKLTRVGHKIPTHGKKHRICKKCKANLDVMTKKKK